MKVTIESTDEIVAIVVRECLVTRIAALAASDLRQFNSSELEECRPPGIFPRAFPMKLIL